MAGEWAVWAAVLVAVALVAIGVAGFVAPERASRHYGIAVGRGDAVARSWASAAAWRDVALGAMVAAGALWASRDMAGALVLAAALVPAGDALVLARHRVRVGRAYAPHVGGTLAMAGVGVALLTV